MPTSDRNKWDARYLAADHAFAEPAAFVVAMRDRLPDGGRALDVAGGAGRHGLWLASLGFDVTIVDVSPVGLALAAERAASRSLTLATLERDLEEDGLPPGLWDVIVCVHYLQRSLLSKVAKALTPGGRFVMVHPTSTNLERAAKPSRRFLLEPGELRGLLPGLDIVVIEESWSHERHEARVLAKR